MKAGQESTSESSPLTHLLARASTGHEGFVSIESRSLQSTWFYKDVFLERIQSEFPSIKLMAGSS